MRDTATNVGIAKDKRITRLEAQVRELEQLVEKGNDALHENCELRMRIACWDRGTVAR